MREAQAEIALEKRWTVAQENRAHSLRTAGDENVAERGPDDRGPQGRVGARIAIGPAALAGPKARPFRLFHGGMELDVLAPGGTRGAGGPAIHARGSHRIKELPVRALVARGDRGPPGVGVARRRRLLPWLDRGHHPHSFEGFRPLLLCSVPARAARFLPRWLRRSSCARASPGATAHSMSRLRRAGHRGLVVVNMLGVRKQE